MTMEQLLVISGMEEPLKLSYEYAVGCRLTPSYCVVSHSRRIRSFLLSHDIPCRALSSPSRVAETPALYDALVGPVQSPLFQQYLLGDVALERPAHLAGVTAADLANDAKRKRRVKPKETTKRRKKKEESVAEASAPTQESGLNPESACGACVMDSTPSLFTSFTDALPLITSSSDHSSLTTDSVFPPPSQASRKPVCIKEASTSVGPSFSNYIQLFNSNGWLDAEKPDLDASIALPTFVNDAPATPPLKAFSPSTNSLFPLPPKFEMNMADKSPRDVNSRVSNLFNRITTSDGNSIPFTGSITPFSPITCIRGNTLGEIEQSFQKDNSLCFPVSFDSKS